MANVHCPDPNLYQLHGQGYDIAYSQTGIDGRPHLEVQRGRRILNFDGEQVSRLSTSIGDLITVTIGLSPDRHRKSLTILVPLVRLPEGRKRQAIATAGIITVARTPVAGTPGIAGAVHSYSVIPLRGAAKWVRSQPDRVAENIVDG